jgi:histidine triad (HIT) family protein
MATVFTRIINGELPGRFVWRDDLCAAFLSINPLKPGHTLVVPREEVDHWIDLDLGTWEHLTRVAKAVGAALDRAYAPEKVGMMLAGLEVPHVHIHVVPIWGVHDLDFANADQDPDPDALDEAAETVRTALRELGASGVADEDR